MQGNIAPRFHRGLVAEDRQRQDLALLRQALEPFHRDEAVDGLQDRLQLRREVEIFLAIFRLRPDFEDHGDYCFAPWGAAGRPFHAGYHSTYNVTWRRKVRSSPRISLCSSAKSKLAIPSLSARSRAR